MAVSARFLFFLTVIAFIGCSSSEQSPQQESNKQKSSAATTANLPGTNRTALLPSPTLDLEKEISSDLSTVGQAPLEPTAPDIPNNLEPNNPEPTSTSNPVLAEQPSTPATSVGEEFLSGEVIQESGGDSPTTSSPSRAPTQPEEAPPAIAPPAIAPPAATDAQGNPLRHESHPGESHPGEVQSGFSSLDSDTVPPSPAEPPQNYDLTSGSFPEETTSDKPAASGEAKLLPVNGKVTSESRPNSKGQPFDPVKVNGPIFTNWPKPELVLLMTGRQNGYVEPCGCAGLERMMGGLTRRDTLIQDLIQKRQWPVVTLDVGNQVKGHKRQTELKFQHTVESLMTMDYSGIGLGIADLQLPAGELAAITTNEDSPFVSANIDLLDTDTELIGRFRIVERNKIKIGITAVIGDSFRKQINSKGIITYDPIASIEKIADTLKKCEVRILLAYADRKESIALAKKFPMFNVIVTADGGSEPPQNFTVIPGTNTYLIEVGEKGSYAAVLGIYRDKKTPVRYQRVPLDSRFATSKRIHRLMGAYQDQLKLLGLEGLSIKPVQGPETKTKGTYIGSKACATCHEQSYDVWRKSKHAKAWKTLVEADPPRNHDPECISCHVVGWDPQRYYPFEGGFTCSKKTPELEGVGCESCHGPGGAHAKAEEGGNLELQERLQKAMVVTIEESRSNPQKMCYNCHDLDNSIEFNFDKYWPEIKHYETDSGEKEDDE